MMKDNTCYSRTPDRKPEKNQPIPGATAPADDTAGAMM